MGAHERVRSRPKGGLDVIADLHCHYPMHLLVKDEEDEMHPDTSLNALVKKVRKRPSLWKKFWPRS